MNTDQFTLSKLDEPVKIPDQQIREFREKGHTLIPGLLSEDEVAASRNIIVRAVEKFNTEKRKIKDRDTYGKAFLQIKNLWQNDVDVKKIVLSKRLARVAADLLGVENVRIYHDQALFKEPGGGHTPWHQDQYYWPLDTDKTITMWMPLVDIDVQMGMLTFASGSHKNGSVLDYEISDKSEEEFDKYVRENNLEISCAETMKAGDATWHYGYTIHNAPGNKSDIMREVFTIIYMADNARITEPKSSWQKEDLKVWLMNKPIGTVADSELNPLVL